MKVIFKFNGTTVTTYYENAITAYKDIENKAAEGYKVVRIVTLES